MPFQIKDFNSIAAAQINHARAVTDKITDFAPGSVARTLIEAPAVEIEELYLQMFLGLRDAIPVATFLSFGFDRLPARRAFGFVSVSVLTPLAGQLDAPAGTAFFTEDGAQYNSTQAVTWPAGTSLVRIPVEAAVTGLAGNAAAGIITSSPFFPSSSGFTVSNALIANGADAESDGEREARFADFVRSLSRGTVQACLFAAWSTTILDDDGNIDEFVTRIGYSEEPGRMRIWLYSNRGLASTELITAVQRRLDGYRTQANEIVPGFRPAGVQVEALLMVERAVPMTIQVGMLPGYTLTNTVRQELQDIYETAIRSIPAGETLRIGSLVEQLLDAVGVSQIVPGATENITCAPSEALTPGVFTINEL